jgi:hypothetical protein
MNRLRFVFRTLSPLRTTIMLFIRSPPNCAFMRKNHQKRTRLKRLFKLCFLLIGSYNINIESRTINTMLTSFMIYSRLRSTMNLLLRILSLRNLIHHQCHVGAAPLPKIYHNEKKPNFSKDNNPKKKGRSARRRHNRHKNRYLAKIMKKGVMCSVGHAVVSSILLRNVIQPSTLCLCTRNP